MGLDITAYRGLTAIETIEGEDDDDLISKSDGQPLTAYLRAYANPAFPGREAPLVHRQVYLYQQAEAVLSRTYGGYNRWRETLAMLAGYPLTQFEPGFGPKEYACAAACWGPDGKTGPFSELINFADNEGVIGSHAAAKLLGDFKDFDERAKQVTEERFYDGYCALRRGLELAADNGALHFH